MSQMVVLSKWQLLPGAESRWGATMAGVLRYLQETLIFYLPYTLTVTGHRDWSNHNRDKPTALADCHDQATICFYTIL